MSFSDSSSSSSKDTNLENDESLRYGFGTPTPTSSDVNIFNGILSKNPFAEKEDIVSASDSDGDDEEDTSQSSKTPKVDDDISDTSSVLIQPSRVPVESDQEKRAKEQISVDIIDSDEEEEDDDDEEELSFSDESSSSNEESMENDSELDDEEEEADISLDLPISDTDDSSSSNDDSEIEIFSDSSDDPVVRRRSRSPPTPSEIESNTELESSRFPLKRRYYPTVPASFKPTVPTPVDQISQNDDWLHSQPENYISDVDSEPSGIVEHFRPPSPVRSSSSRRRSSAARHSMSFSMDESTVDTSTIEFSPRPLSKKNGVSSSQTNIIPSSLFHSHPTISHTPQSSPSFLLSTHQHHDFIKSILLMKDSKVKRQRQRFPDQPDRPAPSKKKVLLSNHPLFKKANPSNKHSQL